MSTLERFVRAMLPPSATFAGADAGAGKSAVATAAVPAEAGMADSFRQSRRRALDGYISGRLVTAYALSELLGPFRIDVRVEGGHVTLDGEVDCVSLRDLAVEIAYSAEGVLGVDCRIRIVREPAPSGNGDPFARRFRDACTTALVKSRLFWNGGSHHLAVNVETRDEVVTLSGRVRNPVDRDLAEQIALLTRGVRHVENRLVAGCVAG